MYKDKRAVSSVHYEKTYYPNGKLKYEGWIVNENPTSKSEIFVNSDSILPTGYAFGVWKFYYKGGAILSIDSNGVSDTAIKRQYFYHKKGYLKKIVTIKPLTTPYKTSDMKFGGKVKRYEWLKRCTFDSSGLLTEEFFFSYEQSGTGKYYKNGKLIRTKEFDKDGYCTKTVKYGT